MSKHLSTPILLHRIAQLEATVGRLSEDLGTLRSAVSKQGLQLPKRRGVRDRVAHTNSSSVDNPQAQASGGLAGATARGEAARVQWVKSGLVVPGEQLAQAWGLTRQALAPAADRGEVFSVKVGNRLYYPQAFLGMDREAVAAICRALGDLGASEKLMFWLREHGALAGRSVATALQSGVGLAKVERLAAAWANERGASKGAGALGELLPERDAGRSSRSTLSVAGKVAEKGSPVTNSQRRPSTRASGEPTAKSNLEC